MKRTLVIPVILLISALLHASAEATGPVFGRLILRDARGRETAPLEITRVRVRAKVMGAVALTEIEQTFYNPTGSQAEGMLYFPVPPGASLSRLAMYVDDVLVEGEIVERARARDVYEGIVRKMRDPALMEWQEGSIFKTRIFPIPAYGPKRILIHYTRLIPIRDGKRRYVYPMTSDLAETRPIGRFEMSVELTDVAPESRIKVPGYDDARVTIERDKATVHLVRTDFEPESDFLVSFTPLRTHALRVFSDRRADEDGFFMISYVPEPGKAAADAPAPGRDFLFLVDTSLSRGPDDFKAQMKSARLLLGRLRPKDRYAFMSFDIVPRAHQDEFISAAKAHIPKIPADLEEIVPLGATDMNAAFEAVDAFLKKNKPRKYLHVIHLGDGMATWEQRSRDELIETGTKIMKRHGARFHAMVMGARHDRLLLETLARRTGGLFRIITPADDVEKDTLSFAGSLDRGLLAAPELKLEGVAVHDVYPRGIGTLAEGEEAIVLGRYREPGRLTVTLTAANRSSATLTTHLPDVYSRHVYIPRLWAREKLNELLLKRPAREVIEEIKDLSYEYTFITPYTSFLVLENEKAYERYGIDRKKRRRYWEELGNLRSAPPGPEPPLGEKRPVERSVPGQEQPARKDPSPAGSPEKEGPFTIADFDLSMFSARPGNRRVATTALCTLCYEVYYRYGSVDFYRWDRSSGWPDNTAIEDLVPMMDTDVPSPDDGDYRLSTADAVYDFNSIGIASSIGIGGGGRGGRFGTRFGGHKARWIDAYGGLGTRPGTDSALKWLARVQNEDGSWGEGSIEETSLALLAFLGSGNTYNVGPFRRTVRNGLEWLDLHQHKDGRIGTVMYDHAWATLALAESYGMTQSAWLKPKAQHALDYLAENQTGKNPLLTSISATAMKSAKIAGLSVPAKPLEEVKEYLKGILGADGTVDQGHLLHTAAVLLGRFMTGASPRDPEIRSGASHLLERVPEMVSRGSDFMYVRYFGNMVEFQVGGRHWKRWNAWNKRLLIDSQIVVGEHAGSWDPGDVWCPRNPMPGPMPDAKGRVVDALLKVEQEPGERKNCAALAKALGSIDDLEYLKQLLAAPGRCPQIAKDMISLRIGMILSGLEKHDEVVPIYAGIYERSGRPANVRRRYVTALIRAGMHRKALDILLPADRTADIDFPSTNTILLLAFSEKSDMKGPLDHVYSRLNPENSSHTRLKYVLAREARRRGRTDWTARLLGDVYRGTGRPESLVKAYVNALLSTKQNREASGELEYAIRAGYRAPWAFESLADTYHALEKGDAEVLRAITSEIDLYPRTRMPRTQLAKYWSKLGKTRKEIDLVREITKEILEERLDEVRHYRADDAP